MSFKPKQSKPIPDDIFRKIYGNVPNKLECEIRNNVSKRNFLKCEIRTLKRSISSMSLFMKMFLIFKVLNKKSEIEKLSYELGKLSYEYHQMLLSTIVYNRIYKANKEIDLSIKNSLTSIDELLNT